MGFPSLFILSGKKIRDPHMPSRLLTGVHHSKAWSFTGDNHHKDSVTSFLLTSSRINLNTVIAVSRIYNMVMLIINVNGHADVYLD
jgi:hypothetical protein